MAAIRLAVAISVLDGTQSVSTHDPPRPLSSTTVTSAPSCAATRAASYPPGPPPMITMRVCGWLTMLHSVASALTPGHQASIRPDQPGQPSHPHPLRPRTLMNRGVVRGLRQQHGSGADGRTLPALTPGRHRLARRLATHLRRRGLGWEGALADRRRGRRGTDARVFVVLYELSEGDEQSLDRWDGATLGYYSKLQDQGRNQGRGRPGLAVRAERLRGRPAIGPLPGDHV